MLTGTQAKFVALEKQRKALLDAFDTALQAVAEEVKPGGYFQDEDGTVYKIVTPAGRWVKYDAVSYARTRRADEDKGSLSLEEAKRAGYALKDDKKPKRQP